ncbi:hypothetical protein JG688_00008994 [Phytophthora aleatoria]|uniref:Uncharacterized protein n=1 Tax=Phytophthora aleatoria TaxID=2496075 RepID=A0A8J5IM81_9STRA|nr:hypothetical protein JG688_00008994 [Phytophthora aleatoria]
MRLDQLPKARARLSVPAINIRCPRLIQRALGHGSCLRDTLASEAPPASKPRAHLMAQQRLLHAAAVMQLPTDEAISVIATRVPRSLCLRLHTHGVVSVLRDSPMHTLSLVGSGVTGLRHTPCCNQH